MTLHDKILDFNQKLIETGTECSIIDYVKNINNIYENPIDLSFMEELMSFVENDKYIPHTLLVKYGAFKEINSSANVKHRLDGYNYKIDKDYRLLNVQEPVKQGGYTVRKLYYLHPDTFKKILMRSKCEDKYIDYYLLLEK